MKNLDAYFYDAIYNSIYALKNDVKSIVEFYGDPSECTMQNYFQAQISGGKLYDHTEEFSDDTYLCEIEEYESEFEDQRLKAFNAWFEGIVDDTDEDDLIEAKVEINPITDNLETEVEGEFKDVVLYNQILFKGKESDISDSEFATNGDSLFERIHSLMGECSCGQNVRKAAILAGAKYTFCETLGDDYTLHFWRDHE
jgi:hypothetical protein